MQSRQDQTSSSFDKALVDTDRSGSFFGLADRLMNQMLRSDFRGLSSSMTSNSNDPNVKVFGMSSMNVTQISRGADGRPRIVQAHDERRMGPGGVWQTKKALRDPDRGIDRMQVGYFIGDQGEIIERRLDSNNGQYRQETHRRALPSNETNFAQQWRTQAEQSMQRPTRSNTDQHYQQALPASSYQYN
jgi:hypothetical protein